ncbi:hypothetical protein HPP92_013433 [Vanilla planifolia]|uniref:Uncharacterized protein n=1 Tax=Vanilla planifolia TaxID=51239 RepID=A0A835QZD9_VANPL|nr:hypothetical protein HPP92_013433 [Vanilla planifolia]
MLQSPENVGAGFLYARGLVCILTNHFTEQREEQKNGQIPMKDEATEKKEDEKKYNEKKEEEPAEKVLRV